MNLLRKLFWFAMFLVATFLWIVLFEHGPSDFQYGMRAEFEKLQKYYNTKLEKKEDKSDNIPSSN